MKREEVFAYAEKAYGTVPEYLWKRYPEDAILRRRDTGKWYAVVMKVSREKLGLEGCGEVEIMNVKCEPEMVHVVIQAEGFLPGYHMNKEHWITILLDGTVDKTKVLDFLDKSYELLGRKKGSRKR